MKNLKYSKNDLIFLYKRQNFQESLFAEEILKLKELLFNDKVEVPELCKPQPKKIKYSNCFVITPQNTTEESNLKPRSASTIKPNNNYINRNQSRKDSNNDENKNIVRNQFFNSNHNYNENKISQDNANNICCNCANSIKNKLASANEFFLCRENSISIINTNLIDYERNDKIVNLNNDLSYLLNFKNDNKKFDINDKMIVKGKKFSEVSDKSSNNF